MRTTPSFPTARIPSRSGGLPVDVTLIAQLGPGAGDALCHEAIARQRGHGSFSDALDEPSATLAGTDIAHGEKTALHSFAVGANGHPFHRHAGHRVFTAVSGSGGAQLRFCTASDEQLAQSPRVGFLEIRMRVPFQGSEQLVLRHRRTILQKVEPFAPSPARACSRVQRARFFGAGPTGLYFVRPR